MDATLRDLLDGATGAPALEDDTGAWSRGELAAAAGGVAHALRRAGVRPGDRVAIRAGNGRPLVAGLLGARAAGALAVPVDPRWPAGVLEGLAAAAVVIDPGAPPWNPPPGSCVVRIGALAPLEITPGPEAALGVATSGSTGAQRVVVLAEAGVAFVTDVLDRICGYRPGDRVLCPLPLHHTYGLSQLWLSLRAGAVLVLPQGPVLAGDLARHAETATVLPAVSTLVRSLLATGARPRLRLVTLAGQATSPADRARFAAALPDTAFVVYYGQTEATTRILWLPPEEFLLRAESAGRPIPGIVVELAEDGELVTQGPHIALGYLDDPAATARRFSCGWLRTGDLFAPVAGGFRFLGRADGVFKRAGEKVAPELIEAAALAHPAVAACLVTAEPGPDGELAPVAWVVPLGEPGEGEILRFLRRRLPGAMVPVAVRYVASLPTNSAGKLVRRPPPP